MLIDINKYVGLTVEEAEERATKDGLILRKAREDKENYVLTMEYRNNRINIEVDNGKITNATVG